MPLRQQRTLRTECRNGHDMREDSNVSIRKDGFRMCNKCLSHRRMAQASAKRVVDANGQLVPAQNMTPKTYSERFALCLKRRHAMTPANTEVDLKSGHRYCKACRNLRTERYRAKHARRTIRMPRALFNKVLDLPAVWQKAIAAPNSTPDTATECVTEYIIGLIEADLSDRAV